MRKIAVILAVLALGGCKESEAEQTAFQKLIESPEAVELSTASPDAAVKSWWSLRDADARFAMERCPVLDMKSPFTLQRGEILSDELIEIFSARSVCDRPEYEREIVDIEVESDLRAYVVANIKNISPPSPHATLNLKEIEQKKEGERMRYLLERNEVPGSWRISQIYYFSSMLNGTWVPLFTEPDPEKNTHVPVRLQ